MKKIDVVLINKSVFIQNKLKKLLLKDPEIKVIGSATNALAGRDLIVYHEPDIVILDIDLPRISGLTLLKKIMQYKPIPVIMSGDFNQQKQKVLQAKAIGAKGFISTCQDDLNNKISNKIKQIYSSNVKKAMFLKNDFFTNKLIAIGSSTGGTLAIREVLQALPRNMPPILIVQHMPNDFMQSFVNNLNKISSLNVTVAKDHQFLENNHVYLAPGDRHMIIKKINDRFVIKLRDGHPVHFQKPAVEVLFNSVAKIAGKRAIGVILTGMGKDGAKGLLKMRKTGALTIGQDKESSVVYGMPKEAFDLGAVMKQLPLNEIPNYLVQVSRSSIRK